MAVSRTDNDVKAILANPAMIQAYKSGVPANGKPFSDGSKVVTVGWCNAQFNFDTTSNKFTAYGNDASFGNICYAWHMHAKDTDFIFTKYAQR